MAINKSFNLVKATRLLLFASRYIHRMFVCLLSKVVFYAHMSGDGIGTLNVYMVTNSNQLLLNLTGNQGNYWKRQEVPLSSPENFRIMFEGKVGSNTRVHVCLDDITFSAGCILSSSFETLSSYTLLSGTPLIMMPVLKNPN